MKRLATLALIWTLLGSTCLGDSNISRFAGYYRGKGFSTPLTQFKASTTKEQGGIFFRTGSVRRKWSFRGTDFSHRMDQAMYWEDFEGTATIGRSVIRFKGDSGAYGIKGMIRITPYGILISQTWLNPDLSTARKEVFRFNKV
jgi:hypothetical protein